MTLRLIGLCGNKRAGKDTAADHLVRHHGFTRLAFADALRAEVAEAFQVSVVTLLEPGLKELPLNHLALTCCTDHRFLDWWLSTPEAGAERSLNGRTFRQHAVPRSPRWMTQRWGDWRRDSDPFYWLDRVAAALSSTATPAVVADVRANPAPHDWCEPEFIRRLGGQVWAVRRNPTGSTDSHVTERPIPAQHLDHTLHNLGSIAELHRTIDQYLDLLIERSPA
ncbi:hypothetical protein [Chitiniphilus shinanonensis]|uniref:deoxynucleotide monophosphate kinase family protein n=1 Tax=Chitiniphilus shinanonensis TaxID=553088 RepID=UPI003068ED87